MLYTQFPQICVLKVAEVEFTIEQVHFLLPNHWHNGIRLNCIVYTNFLFAGLAKLNQNIMPMVKMHTQCDGT